MSICRSFAFVGYVIVSALATTSTNAGEQDGIAATSIMTELSCVREPNGLPAAAYLAKTQLIKLNRNVGFDSVSCWKLSRSFDLQGLSVEGFCTATEDALMHILWPDVFYRGPGTSPGSLVSVSTSASEQAVRNWADTNRLSNVQITKNIWFEGYTSVECNSRSLPH